MIVLLMEIGVEVWGVERRWSSRRTSRA